MQNRMPNNKVIIEWSILNFVGWSVGFGFVLPIQSNFEITYYRIVVWQIMLAWLPLGVSIAIFQWLWLKRLGINLILWVFVTAVGISLLITSVYWVADLRYDSSLIPQGRIYLGEFIGNINIGKNISVLLVGISILLGGLITSGLQAMLMHKIIPNPWLWIRSNMLGFLVPAAMVPLAFFFKLIVLSTIYFFDYLLSFYNLYMVEDAMILLAPFLFTLAVSISISLPTGKVLNEITKAKSNS
jgi:hypothetical protein